MIDLTDQDIKNIAVGRYMIMKRIPIMIGMMLSVTFMFASILIHIPFLSYLVIVPVSFVAWRISKYQKQFLQEVKEEHKNE